MAIIERSKQVELSPDQRGYVGVIAGDKPSDSGDIYFSIVRPPETDSVSPRMSYRLENAPGFGKAHTGDFACVTVNDRPVSSYEAQNGISWRVNIGLYCLDFLRCQDAPDPRFPPDSEASHSLIQRANERNFAQERAYDNGGLESLIMLPFGECYQIGVQQPSYPFEMQWHSNYNALFKQKSLECMYGINNAVRNRLGRWIIDILEELKGEGELPIHHYAAPYNIIFVTVTPKDIQYVSIGSADVEGYATTGVYDSSPVRVLHFDQNWVADEMGQNWGIEGLRRYSNKVFTVYDALSPKSRRRQGPLTLSWGAFPQSHGAQFILRTDGYKSGGTDDTTKVEFKITPRVISR